MMSNRNRDEAVAEGDLVDQLTPVDPAEEEVALAPLSSAAAPVSEADWIDQQLPVPQDQGERLPGVE